MDEPLRNELTPNEEFKEVKLVRSYHSFFNRMTRDLSEDCIRNMVHVFITTFIAHITKYNSKHNKAVYADKFNQHMGLFCITLVTQLVNVEDPRNEILMHSNRPNMIFLKEHHIDMCLHVINLLKTNTFISLPADSQTTLKEALSAEAIRLIEQEEQALGYKTKGPLLVLLQSSLQEGFMKHSSNYDTPRTNRAKN